MKTLGTLLLFIGVSAAAFATPPLPEVDPGFAGSAIALIAGAALIVRSRVRK